MGRLYHMGTCVRNMVRGEAENFNAGIVWEYGIPIFFKRVGEVYGNVYGR